MESRRKEEKLKNINQKKNMKMSLAGKRNKARAERRRRARKRLMAAELEATTKLQTRGGKKPRKKTAVRKRYRQKLQKKIQQRQRHREVNRQIWARLQALTDKVQYTETTLLQLATGEDKKVRNHPTDQMILEKAMAGRHWVAIGDEDERSSEGQCR